MFRTQRHLLLYLILAGSAIHAQSELDHEVKQSILTFFEGFHKQDTTIIKSVAGEGMVLQTIGTDQQGNSRLRTDSFEHFLTSLISIPDSLEFREELLDFKIQIDGPMAHAWTPYRFWIDQQLSHCGVNSFQLFNDGTRWRIIYLADTRRKEACE